MNRKLTRIRILLGAVFLIAGTLVGQILKFLVPNGAFSTEAQWSFLGLSVAFGGVLVLWTTLDRTGLNPMLDTALRRRRAHAYPFLVARFCVLGSIGVGLLMGCLHFFGDPSLNRSLSTAVITYLLTTPPTFGLYLGLRRLLRPTAEGLPGADPIGGQRQPIRMRVLFAVQVPAVMCGIGITLLTNAADVHYTQSVTIETNDLSQHLQEQSLNILGHAQDRSRMAEFQDGSQPSETDPDWEAIVLLIGVLSLSYYFCGSLADDVCRDLDGLSRGLANIEDPRAPPVGPWVGLRETESILKAFKVVVNRYGEQRQLIQEAAEQRREAEAQKSTFLAHVSHELKSPLNSILGFSELLLAELDGPLKPEQKDAIGQVWLLGDRLLRFILAILDLARLESTTRTAARQRGSEGLKVRLSSATELSNAIDEQRRLDPLSRHSIVLIPPPDEHQIMVEIDSGQTARALLLIAGSLADAMHRGQVEIVITETADAIHAQVSVGEAEAIPGGARSVSDVWASLRDDGIPQTGSLPLRLLNALVELQGGEIQVTQSGPWPCLTLACPATTT